MEAAAPVQSQRAGPVYTPREPEKRALYQRRGVISLVTAPGDGEVTVVTDETMGEQDPLLAGLLAAATAGLRPLAQRTSARSSASCSRPMLRRKWRVHLAVSRSSTAQRVVRPEEPTVPPEQQPKVSVAKPVVRPLPRRTLRFAPRWAWGRAAGQVT